ncbi:MAG: hypothetical protein Q9162_003507 [Coniocarpon cinnabarinum]
MNPKNALRGCSVLLRPIFVLRTRTQLSGIAARRHASHSPASSVAAQPTGWLKRRDMVAASIGALTVAGLALYVNSRQRTRDTSDLSKALPKHHYADQGDLEKGVAELRTILGEDGITTDAEELHRHGFSDWSTTNADRLPVAVAYPKSTEDVSAIAKVCSRRRIPMGDLLHAL